jgi:hypothetical protein
LIQIHKNLIFRLLKRMFNPESKYSLSIENLRHTGAIEFAGFSDENNEPLYIITPKINEISPELNLELKQQFQQLILSLWEKGFINVDWLEDDPIVQLAEASMDDEKLRSLPSLEKLLISDLKRLTKN